MRIDDRIVYRVSVYDIMWHTWIPLGDVRISGGIKAVKNHLGRYHIDWNVLDAFKPIERRWFLIRVSDPECNKFYFKWSEHELQWAKKDDFIAPRNVNLVTRHNDKFYICYASI